MHTISMLRRALGLSTDNQVRNRMERIKDLLVEHIRRGPNNQIFLTDPGLDIMKQFQELQDTGLTLADASTVLRTTSYNISTSEKAASSRSGLNANKPGRAAPELADLLQEMTLIRTHIAALQERLPQALNNEASPPDSQPWWTYLREEIGRAHV